MLQAPPACPEPRHVRSVGRGHDPARRKAARPRRLLAPRPTHARTVGDALSSSQLLQLVLAVLALAVVLELQALQLLHLGLGVVVLALSTGLP